MLFGTFDILHKGHLNLFEQAKQFGDKLIVVIARDKTVEEVKGKLPRHSEEERLNKVKSEIKGIGGRAILGQIRNKYNVIKKYKPNIICLGYDQKHFLDKLKELKIPIKKLKPYKPQKYKSSKLKPKFVKKIKKQKSIKVNNFDEYYNLEN